MQGAAEYRGAAVAGLLHCLTAQRFTENIETRHAETQRIGRGQIGDYQVVIANARREYLQLGTRRSPLTFKKSIQLLLGQVVRPTQRLNVGITLLQLTGRLLPDLPRNLGIVGKQARHAAQ